MTVAFSTALVPCGRGRRVATGLFMAGPVGLVANLLDERGSVAPRLSGTVGVAGALWMQVVAMNDLFVGDDHPDPTVGPWVGVAALVVVLVGCLIGTRTERVQPGYA